MFQTLRSLTRLGRGLIVPAALSGVLAACSAAGPGATVAPAASVAPAGAVAQSAGPTVAASLGAAPSSAPEPSAAPSASTAPIVALPTPAAGGGRYGGGGSSSPAPNATPKLTPRPAPKQTPKPSPTLVIKAGSTSLGSVLVDSDGLTLYVYGSDSANHSNCTGGCASAWPPLLVKAGTRVSGGSGVHGHFATFKRSDGTTQVSYNGKPLYGWTGDSQPGDTTGQGLNGFSVARV